jgi:hypothetical protein
MAGVRRGSRAVLRYFAPLYVIAVVLQVYFAGEGIFGARDQDQTIENAKTLDLHRDFGWFITEPIALLLLIVALLAWLPNTRVRILSIVTPFVLWVQLILPSGGRWVAAFHPLNAILILVLLAYLTWALWTHRSTTRERPATAAL